MIRSIIPSNHPSLRGKSKPVKKIDKKVLSLIKDLKDTLVAQENPVGIGLAAPQIGKNVRVFIIKPTDTMKAFINPKIISTKTQKEPQKHKTKSEKSSSAKAIKGGSADKKIMEGCLSLPHYYGPLRRPKIIKLKYWDEDSKERIETFEGLEAQIIQHEIDHLEGVLFVDHLLKQKKPLYELVNGEWERVDLIV